MEQVRIESSLIYRQIPPLSANHQWIVAQNLDATKEGEAEFQVFYNVHYPIHHYRCQIPELLGKQVRGCFYGWVILSGYPDNVIWSLWNPVTSKVINLPRLVHITNGPLAYFCLSSPPDDPSSILIKTEYCCLTSPPDDPNSLLLMTRVEKTHFVFCRLHPKKKKLKWTERSYAEQVKKLTNADGFLDCLICCNGKVYAYADGFLIVELSIVVKDTQVAINILPLLKFPHLPLLSPSNLSRPYLVGTCKDIFLIFLDLDAAKSICFVHLCKLDTSNRSWEIMEDLRDATIVLDEGAFLYPEFHSLATGSQLGGYIHIVNNKGRVIHSYHVKDKTISLSSLPCIAGESYVSSWAMLGCKRLLEGDHKQEEDKKDKIVVSKVKSHEVEFIGTADESSLLNLPYEVLEMIIQSCIGVEYMNFRASCKLCYLAAPVIQWSDQTSSKRLQLKEYSLVSPWLTVFEKHTITLIDPMFGDKYFIKTPRKSELVGELTMHCSRYGWLLMGQWYGPLFFFNPFTSDTRKLPKASDLVRFDFSAPPTSPDCIVVGFTSRFVLIHFVGRDPYWHRHTLDYGNDDPDLYRFPAFCGDDVCALRNGIGVDVFKDVGDLNCERECVVDEVPVSSCTSKAQRYLVKCEHEYKCDRYLIMLVVGEFGESVEVFIPNKDAARWDKIDDIGRHVIYIGDKTCLCMEAKTAKMENKIYFPRLHSGKIVFYSFETRKFHTFSGGNILESFKDFSGTRKHLQANAWIEPAWS